MRYLSDKRSKNRPPGCLKAGLTGLFVFLSMLQAKTQDHWTPAIDAFDNYMTITAYIIYNGLELQSDQIEVGCFIDDECRGNFHLQPMEYMGHPYTCFLAVWGNASDNGKTITFRVYDHEAKTELEADQKPAYEYNGDLGTDDPYELTLPSIMHRISIGSIENGTVTVSPENPVEDDATVTLTVTLDKGYKLDSITVYKTGDSSIVVAAWNAGSLLPYTFTMPAYDVSIVVTIKTSNGIDNILQVKPLRASVRNNTLLLSGLTADEPWSIYNICGALFRHSTANSENAEVTLTVRGVYIIQSDRQTIKVVY